MEKKIGSNGLDCFAAFCVSFVLFAVEVFNLANYGTGYDAKLICIAGGFFVFWLSMFVARSKAFFGVFRAKTVVCILFLSLCIGVYLANTIWNNNYLSLNPLALLSEGNAHIDNLFHSSIAAGYAHYGYSSLLVNFPSLLKYHTFSHLILGFVSRITGIPTYFVYCYIYSLTFFPLYVYLILNVINSLLQIVSKNTKMAGLREAFIVALFIIGVLPTEFSNRCAIWISSSVGSESCLVALVLSLLYFKILLYLYNSQSSKQKVLWIFILNPLFIFLCTFAKVSVGFLLAAGIMYYVFRKYTKSIKWWLINIAYLGVFFAAYFLSSTGGGDLSNGIHLLDFVRNYSTPSLWVMHYLIYFFLAGCFLCSRLSKKTLPSSIKTFLSSQDFILEEIILVVSILGALPGILLHIGGGSAGYFELPVRLLILIVFCGFDCTDFLVDKLRQSRFIYCCFMIFAITNLLFNMRPVKLAYSMVFNRFHYSENKPEHFKERIKAKIAKGEKDIIPYCWNVFSGKSQFANASFYKNIIAINKITQGHKKEYAMFVDDTAELWEIYKDNDNRKTAFVYPAITNMLCLNEAYFDDEYMYNRSGIVAAKANYYYYGFQTIRKEPKKSFSQVCLEAKDMGYKKIVRLYEDKFEVLDLY